MQYLIEGTSYCTFNSFHNEKTLLGHVYFTSGWVDKLQVDSVNKKTVMFSLPCWKAEKTNFVLHIPSTHSSVRALENAAKVHHCKLVILAKSGTKETLFTLLFNDANSSCLVKWRRPPSN